MNAGLKAWQVCIICRRAQPGEKLHRGSAGRFSPEMQKRAPENCNRLQCKSLFNVADLVNGMWKVDPYIKIKFLAWTQPSHVTVKLSFFIFHLSNFPYIIIYFFTLESRELCNLKKKIDLFIFHYIIISASLTLRSLVELPDVGILDREEDKSVGVWG